MSKITIELAPEQIKEAFEKLPVKERLTLADELNKITRRARWDMLLKQIRSRVAKHPISQQEIDRICQEVRQERYERNKGGH